MQGETQLNKDELAQPAKKCRVEDGEEDSDKWMDEIDLEIEQHIHTGLVRATYMHAGLSCDITYFGRMEILRSQLAPPEGRS